MEEEKLSKTFSIFLILDWETGKYRVLAKKPRRIKFNEIPILFSLKVNLPNLPNVFANGEVTISEAKTGELVVEAL